MDEEKTHYFWGMTFLTVLRDAIDYGYTHYIHKARHLFPPPLSLLISYHFEAK